MLRVTAKTHDSLRAIAKEKGRSMQQVVEQAVEAYRRQMILDETNAAYASLRKDSKAWAEVETEQAAWDATLRDGLEDS
jgi:succinate dehydrogenase/fumarate reductase flavoprotein subunit